MKFIKQFATDADYQSFIGGGDDYVEPHIALIKDSYSVIYKRKEEYIQIKKFLKGWTWVSFHVNTMEGENGLNKLKELLGSNCQEIKTSTIPYASETTTNLITTYDTTTNTWNGNLTSLDLRYFYIVKCLESATIEFSGNPVNPENYIIEIGGNPEKAVWSYFGFPSKESLSIDIFNNFACDGDWIKSQRDFAQYYEGEWHGTFNTLTPGEGYKYKNTSNISKTIIFTNPPIVNTEAVSTFGLRRNVIEPNNHYNVTPNDFNDNMTMIALVNNVNNENYELGAFVNGECRGTTHPLYVDILDKWLFFIMIYGNVNDEEVTFKYYDNENDEEITLDSTVTFSKDKTLGHVNQPYIL